MDKLKIFIPIILALGIAFGGSVLLYQWIEQKTAPEEVVTVKKDVDATPVVVAKSDLEWGTVLKKEMLKTVPFFRESLPENYYSKPDELIGRVLVTHLSINEPVTEARLAPDDVKTGGVAAVLDKGKRAVSVRGNKVMGLAGFIRPGNRVDVLLTTNNPENGKDLTKLVMDNVPVLATGSKIVTSEEGKQSPVDVYTLEVTPEEAEKLTLASSRGQLQFALRNIKDSERVLTSGAYMPETLNSLFKGNPTKTGQSKKRQQVAHHSPKHTVEVINGENSVKKKF